MIRHKTTGQGKSKPLAVVLTDSHLPIDKLQECYEIPESKIHDVLYISVPTESSARTRDLWEKTVEPLLKAYHSSHVMLCNANLYKTMTGKRKASDYGIPAGQYSLGVDYRLLTWDDERLVAKHKLALSIVSELILEGRSRILENWQAGNQSHNYIPPDPAKAAAALYKLSDTKPVALDVETTGLNWFSEDLLSAALRCPTHTAVLDFLRFPELKVILKRWLLKRKGPLIFHNANFDVKVLIRQLWDPELQDMEQALEGLHTLCRGFEDTRVMAYLALNSTEKVNLELKDLAYADFGNWEGEDHAWELPEGTLECPRRLLDYNLTDVKATYTLYQRYSNKLATEGLESLYRDVFLPALKTVIWMEYTGLGFSREEKDRAQDKLETLTREIREKIASNPVIRDSYEPVMRKRMAEEANKKLKKLRKTEEDFNHKSFNPGSTKEMRILLYEHLGLPVTSQTKTGLPATDARTLNTLIHTLRKNP